MIKSTPLKIRSFRVFNLTGCKGDSYIFELPTTAFLTDLGNISVWHTGIMETDIIEGDEIAKQFLLNKKYRKPLDTSMDDKHIRFNKVVVKYTCITNTFGYYCVSNKDNYKLNTVKIVKLTGGETVNVPANSKNFLAVGKFFINDTILEAPCEVLDSKDSLLTLISDSGLVLIQ